jgi:molecular chaperone HtpG
MGVMKLEEILRLGGPVRYVATVDGFQQVARVAMAQGICVVNAGYVHDTALLEKLDRLLPDREVIAFSAADLPHVFEELTVDERRRAHPVLQAAAGALRAFGCELHVKKFLPADLPALYAADDQASFSRDLERAREKADALFGSLLDSVAKGSESSSPCLYLNLHNPVIVRLVEVTAPEILRTLVEMLYVQALLLGHRPLRAGEMALLNRGLSTLITAVTEPPRGMLH